VAAWCAGIGALGVTAWCIGIGALGVTAWCAGIGALGVTQGPGKVVVDGASHDDTPVVV